MNADARQVTIALEEKGEAGRLMNRLPSHRRIVFGTPGLLFAWSFGYWQWLSRHLKRMVSS